MSESELPSDEAMIDAYVRDIQFKELRPTTVRNTASNLRKFAREVGLRTATSESLQDWLSRDSLQPQSRAGWITKLHVFYVWANRRGYFERVKDHRGHEVDFDPTAELNKPKSRKGKPHPISDADLDKALELADPLMRCWLLAGALAGCRCQEIAGIRREDVYDDKPEPSLNIEFGKGNKSRTVPLHPQLLEALQKLPMRTSGPLWDMTPQQMSKAINEHLHVTVGTKSTAHALRHFFGTRMYQSSLDLQLVATLMGHTNTAVTSIYAAPDQRKAASILSSIRIG